MKEGQFREDLFYRIHVVTFQIPPLRERREDISVFVEHFIERYARENQKTVRGVSRETRDLLFRYDYPGNVRELENIIERAIVISRDELISSHDLPFQECQDIEDSGEASRPGTLQDALEDLERGMIREALEKAESNQSQAARLLGLSERMLRYKLKKYGFK